MNPVSHTGPQSAIHPSQEAEPTSCQPVRVRKKLRPTSFLKEQRWNFTEEDHTKYLACLRRCLQKAYPDISGPAFEKLMQEYEAKDDAEANERALEPFKMLYGDRLFKRKNDPTPAGDSINHCS